MGVELVEIIRLSALAIAIMFIGQLMKKAGQEDYFKVISMIALIGIMIIVIGYITQFFEALETMIAF